MSKSKLEAMADAFKAMAEVLVMLDERLGRLEAAVLPQPKTLPGALSVIESKEPYAVRLDDAFYKTVKAVTRELGLEPCDVDLEPWLAQHPNVVLTKQGLGPSLACWKWRES